MEYLQENHALEPMIGESQGANKCHRCSPLGGVFLTVTLFQTTVNTCVLNAWMTQETSCGSPFIEGEEMMKSLKEGVGHTLFYLSPYSPDLNPLERKWGQAKAYGRKIHAF